MPNLAIIGAMKCATSALHFYLGQHPEIAMSNPKELNFFLDEARDVSLFRRVRYRGPDAYEWSPGNWHRGPSWYARHFSADSIVRGEASPGYTSPSGPYVAQRMAGLIPTVRLVYLVRDPVDRALSQYRHHRRDGTEARAPDDALLDPDSQYVARSRYHERLAPFLEHFGRHQIAIVAREDLLTRRRATLRALFEFLGVEEGFWSDGLGHTFHRSDTRDVPLNDTLRTRLAEAFVADADALRALARRDFPGWCV